jgi:gas vesicle protein
MNKRKTKRRVTKNYGGTVGAPDQQHFKLSEKDRIITYYEQLIKNYEQQLEAIETSINKFLEEELKPEKQKYNEINDLKLEIARLIARYIKQEYTHKDDENLLPDEFKEKKEQAKNRIEEIKKSIKEKEREILNIKEKKMNSKLSELYERQHVIVKLMMNSRDKLQRLRNS